MDLTQRDIVQDIKRYVDAKAEETEAVIRLFSDDKIATAHHNGRSAAYATISGILEDLLTHKKNK